MSVLLLLCGCTTPIYVQTTNSWEGHYYSKAEVQEAVQNMNLNKNESVWLISNNTIYQLLKNEGKTK